MILNQNVEKVNSLKEKSKLQNFDVIYSQNLRNWNFLKDY